MDFQLTGIALIELCTATINFLFFTIMRVIKSLKIDLEEWKSWDAVRFTKIERERVGGREIQVRDCDWIWYFQSVRRDLCHHNQFRAILRKFFVYEKTYVALAHLQFSQQCVRCVRCSIGRILSFSLDLDGKFSAFTYDLIWFDNLFIHALFFSCLFFQVSFDNYACFMPPTIPLPFRCENTIQPHVLHLNLSKVFVAYLLLLFSLSVHEEKYKKKFFIVVEMKIINYTIFVLACVASCLVRHPKSLKCTVRIMCVVWDGCLNVR